MILNKFYHLQSMSKNKEEKRVRELYLISVESHLVTLLELLADNKLLIASGTVVSAEDCLDKLKANLKTSTASNGDDFLCFISSQMNLTQDKLLSSQKEALEVKKQFEALRKGVGQLGPSGAGLHSRSEFNLPRTCISQPDDVDQKAKGSGINPSLQITKEFQRKYQKIEGELREQIDTRDKQLRKEKASVIECKAEIQSLNELIKRFQSQNNKYSSKLYQANQVIDSLREQKSNLQSQKVTPRSREQEYKSSQALQQAQSLREEKLSLSLQVSSLHRRINQMEIESRKMPNITQQELAELRTLTEQRLRQLNRLRLSFSELQNQQLQVLEENNQLKTVLDRTNQSVIVLQTKNYDLQKLCNTKLTITEEVQQQIVKSQTQCDDLRQDLLCKNNLQIELQRKLEQLDSKTTQLQLQLEAAIVSKEQMRTQLITKLEEATKSTQKSLDIQTTVAKFNHLVVTLQGKHTQKKQLLRKALSKVQAKTSKAKDVQASLRQCLKRQFLKFTSDIQTFVKEQLLIYKQKYLLYKKNYQQQQYNRHMLLLRQIDTIRQEVQRKEVKVNLQQNRILETVKRQNHRLQETALFRVKSQEYLGQGQPSYVNRF